MSKTTVSTALKATGRGLTSVLVSYADLAAKQAEQERLEREIQEHVDALKALKPGYDIVFTQKF